jgi:hypothetical protein
MLLMRYLREWPMNVNFTGIREESELEKLPPCDKLWSDVARLIADDEDQVATKMRLPLADTIV